MAKIVIEVDTDEATIAVKVNGKSVDNVDYVSASNYLDTYSRNPKPEVSCNISTKVVSSDGVKTYTNICAEKSPEGRTAMQLGTTRAAHDGFLINPVVKEVADANQYSEATAAVKKAFSGILGNRREKV